MQPWQRRRLLEPCFEANIPFEDEVGVFNDAAAYFFGDRLLKYIFEHGGSAPCADLFDDDVNVRYLFLDIDAWLTNDPNLWKSLDMFLCRFGEAFCSLSEDVKESVRCKVRSSLYVGFPSRVIDIIGC
jgi:hypothetical protein